MQNRSKQGTGRSFVRRIRRVVASAAIVFTALSTLGAPSPAHAYTVSSTGRPGQVSLTRNSCSWNYGDARLNSGKIYAYRSPASTGVQRITIQWAVKSFTNNTWTWVYYPSATYTVNPGYHVEDGGWSYSGQDSGYLATDTTIWWSTPSGTPLGSARNQFVHANDYMTSSCGYITAFGGQYGLVVS